MTAATDFETLAGELAMAGEMPQPGSWRGALYRADAPGAALDGQPWAKSWGTFMRAILDEEDSSARQFIANVTASRPQNAGFAERIPAEGGFLVPEQLRSQVLSYMTAAIVRPQAMVLPMGSLKLGVPFLDNPSQASGKQALGGMTFAWAAEGAAITPSNPTFGRAGLEARKLAGFLQNVPDELVDDAAGALGDFLGRVIALGHAWAEDDAFIGGAGTGVGEPQGILSAPCQVAVSRASGGAVMLADIVAMIRALHPASLQAALTPGANGAAWLLSADVLGQLLELYLLPAGATPTAGTPVSLDDWLILGDGRETGASILGIPAFVTDHQPALGTAGDVVLADLRHYLIGDRLEMTVELSRKGGSFAQDATNVRVRSRVDGRYWIQSAYTTEANEQVSPVVVLH